MSIAFRKPLTLLIFTLAFITPALGQSPCAGSEISDRRTPPQEVINYWQKCLTIFEEHDDKKGQTQALHSMAVVHDAERRHQLALELYEKSLALSQEIGDRKRIELHDFFNGADRGRPAALAQRASLRTFGPAPA